MINKNLLKLAKKWKRDKPPEPREKLVQLLERDENGKPKLALTPLEKTAVHTPTQEDYDILMRTYELGGWEWRGGESLTQDNFWIDHKEKTCIAAGVYYPSGVYDEGKFGYDGRELYLGEGWNVISTQQFYETQKITPERLREINEWFDEND